ncbi:MAG: hypothetical protein CL679_03865 [Bermanella sp.]|nr:hypothetical protein [Bermanella sp.]|tara:strand:- start:295 stop:624 length:330 start_codon:yes stop_codon:yes gene_type:complete
MSISIAQATGFIEELLSVIEDVYWESTSMETKNLCFNTVRLLQSELTELTKVSVQDHHYEYESITYQDNTVIENLSLLEHTLKQVVLRTRTQKSLKPLLLRAMDIFANN